MAITGPYTGFRTAGSFVAGPHHTVTGSPLALVEEPTFRDASLVLCRHVDVRGREQENLVGHPLDAPVQPEDQACREVDEALGVAVDHLGQVHDDGDSLAEVFPNGTCFIVGPRMQRRDPREVGRLTGALLAHRRRQEAVLSRPWLPVEIIRPVETIRLLLELLVLFVRLVPVLVAVFVLHEAEVDRHLAHCAGHPSVLRRAYLAAPRRLTRKFYLPGPPATPTANPLPHAAVPRAHLRLTRGTLHDRSLSIAEQRRTNSQVCRTSFYGFFQITAHTRGNHRGVRPDGPDRSRAGRQSGEGLGGGHPEWRDGHHPAQSQATRRATCVICLIRRGHDGFGQLSELTGRSAAPARVATGLLQADLNEGRDHPLPAPGGLVERVDQPQPVHGVDDVGVPGDAGHLVGLQLANEMPAEVQG